MAEEKPAETPPSKNSEKTSEKASEKNDKKTRRLGGEFKGHPVEVAPAADAPVSTPKDKPAAPPATPSASPSNAAKAPSAAPKQIVIDNAMVKSSSPEKDKTAKSPPPRESAAPSAAPVIVSAPVDLNGHDEAYWKQRASSVRQRAAEAQRLLEAARQEEKREETDFYAWDDGQYRDNVIKPAWDKAREETARAEQELKAAQLELENLEDDARKAGAMPGWIRE